MILGLLMSKPCVMAAKLDRGSSMMKASGRRYFTGRPSTYAFSAFRNASQPQVKRSSQSSRPSNPSCVSEMRVPLGVGSSSHDTRPHQGAATI